jgi:hypothetical protein
LSSGIWIYQHYSLTPYTYKERGDENGSRASKAKQEGIVQGHTVRFAS